MSKSKIVTRRNTVVQDPPIARWLFSDTRSAWIWFILRIWLASFWIPAGWGKLQNPAWVQTGEALKGFWLNAVGTTEGSQIAFAWYRNFIRFLIDIQAYTWMGKLIPIGELAIGIALLLGLLTGFAAFLGGFLNWNFIMAGVASTNGMLFLISMLLVLAWKVAGYYGLDRWVLPYLGTPWPEKPLEEE